MVAPCEVGEPVRSFVRVPTEGRAAEALCLDLSRSSSAVAAAAPVRQALLQHQPALFRNPAGSSPKPSQEKAAATAPLPPAGRPSQMQQVAATICNSKRPREEEEQEGVEATQQPAQKVAKTAVSTEAAAGTPTQSPQSQDEVQLLRQQCQSLRRQNQDLQRRLGLFHALFRDKQRLNSFVKHLDTLVK